MNQTGNPLAQGDFIGKWMAMFIKPGEVVEQREHESMQQFVTRIEKAAVFCSLAGEFDDLPVRPPAGRERRDAGSGALFGVAEGSLFVLEPGREGTHQRRRCREGPVSSRALSRQHQLLITVIAAPQADARSASNSAEIANTRCTATSQVIRVASNAASMFRNTSSTWIAEIATIDTSSFCFSPAKSILVIQIGQFGLPNTVDQRDEILVARKHHDQNEIGDQRDVDQCQRIEDHFRRFVAGRMQDELPEHAQEFRNSTAIATTRPT